MLLPSLIIIFLISLFFNSVLQNQYVSYAFVGIKCAVAFLILKTGLQMLVKMKKTAFNVSVFSIVIASMLCIEVFALNISTIFLILFGGIVGLAIFAFFNKRKVAVLNNNPQNKTTLEAENFDVENNNLSNVESKSVKNKNSVNKEEDK